MTTDEQTSSGQVPRMSPRLRRSAVLGGVAGLALLAGWFGYDYAVTPVEPNPSTAEPDALVSFVAHKRGLSRLSDVEQQRFFNQWRQVLAGQPAKGDALRAYLEAMESDARKAFSDAFFQTSKRAFLADARRFEQLADLAERSRFLRAKVAEYADNARFVKDLAVAFRRDFDTSQDSMQTYLMTRTTPEERALGEPYYRAIQQVGEQMKKEQASARGA